jgi:hypothetical protein
MLSPPAIDSSSEQDAAEILTTEQKVPSDATGTEFSVSRSWFGFGRRSISPGRMQNTSRIGRTRSRSPENPASGHVALESGPENHILAEQEVTPTDDSDAIEVSLSDTVAPYDSVPPASFEQAGTTLTADETSSSYSWFGFRRSKSPSSKWESENNVDLTSGKESLTEVINDSDVVMSTTEKTDEDADWLHEVMSQSTGTNNDDLKSVDFASWLDHDKNKSETINEATGAENSSSSRGQTSWFGFKRSKKSSRFASVSENVEEKDARESYSKPPEVVSVDLYLGGDITINRENSWRNGIDTNSYIKSPSLGVSWFLGETREKSSPEEQFFSRSRLPTESTVHSVSTEELAEIQDSSSGEDFAEEFEKGVAQSFAYLEI